MPENDRLERLRNELERLRSIPPVRSPMAYVWVALALSVLGVTGIAFVVALRLPIAETAAIVAAIVGFLLPTNTAINGMMIKDVHVIVNSRMTELLLATENAAGAEGESRGRAAGKAEEKVDEGDVRQRMTDAADRKGGEGP